jgi:drug/metabolite transporter (DMT)-like permease
MHPLIYVAITIVTIAAAQLILKKGMTEVGQIPSHLNYLVPFFIKTLSNVKVIASVILTFTSSLSWMAALSKLDLSYAYPITALTFVIVLIFSKFLFNEHITLTRWVGVLVIWIGIFIATRK